MKKYAMSLFLVCLLFLVTGCGEKKLTCTNEESSDNNKIQGSWVITYKEDKVIKASNSSVMEASKEIIDSTKSYIEKELDVFKNIKGVSITSKQYSDTKYQYDMTFDFKNLDFEALNTAFGENSTISKDITLEKFKENITAQGYKCE